MGASLLTSDTIYLVRNNSVYYDNNLATGSSFMNTTLAERFFFKKNLPVGVMGLYELVVTTSPHNSCVKTS